MRPFSLFGNFMQPERKGINVFMLLVAAGALLVLLLFLVLSGLSLAFILTHVSDAIGEM